MAGPVEVTGGMRERQRRDPAQWSMAMQQWVDVIRHCMQQPEYVRLQEERCGTVTTYDLNEAFVKPWTRGTGCSVSVLMTGEEERHARLLVSHAWGGGVSELLASMERFFGNRDIGYDLPIWFCAFGNYQPGDRAGPTIQEQLAMDPFACVIESHEIKKSAGGKGVVAVHTTAADLYSRLWCVHEVDRALGQDGVEVSGALSEEYVAEVDRRVGMFLEVGSTVDEALVAAGIGADTAKAKCGSPSDELMLVKIITSRPQGFERMDAVIRRFRTATIPSLVFDLERWAASTREALRGRAVTVWRIGPGRFRHHGELMGRMEELGVDWREIHVDPGDTGNAMAGSPAISQAWKETTESGVLPDLVWEEGGRLSRDEKEFPFARAMTRSSGILHHMNGVAMFSPKAATGHEHAKKLMCIFDDVSKDAAAWQDRFPNAGVRDAATRLSLQAGFISAAVSVLTGNARSLRLLCHPMANYHREVHSSQFTSNPATVVRAFPTLTWASSSVAVVAGVVSLDSPNYFGNQDMLSFWLKEAGEWKLLSMTNDPHNTSVDGLTELGERVADHLAQYQEEEPGAVDSTAVASRPYKAPGQKPDEWQWLPASTPEPFVQVAEFHYGAGARFCLLGPAEHSVTDGRLWTKGATWTLRIWTLRKGTLTIGSGADFDH